MGLVGGGSRSVVRARLSSQRSAAVALLTSTRRLQEFKTTFSTDAAAFGCELREKPSCLTPLRVRCVRVLYLFILAVHTASLHRARPVRP